MIMLKRERRPASGNEFGWEEFKDTIAFVLLILFSIFLLGHLVAFWFVGSLVIGESSGALLAVEIVMVSGIIVLGIERLRSHLKAK